VLSAWMPTRRWMLSVGVKLSAGSISQLMVGRWDGGGGVLASSFQGCPAGTGADWQGPRIGLPRSGALRSAPEDQDFKVPVHSCLSCVFSMNHHICYQELRTIQ